MSIKSFALAAISCLVFSSSLVAKELELSGRASVPAVGDVQTIKSNATKLAKRNAVIAGLNRLIGPEAASDPKVAQKIQIISDQINDNRIVDSRGVKVGNDYEMTLTLIIDDKEFRTLISDAGIATNTATTRSFGILALMDEFLTSPRDLKAPLEELTEFRAEKGNSFKDKSINAKSANNASANSSNSASSIDARSSASVDAKASSSAKASGSYSGNIDASGRASVSGSARDSTGSGNFDASREGKLSASENAKFSGERSSSGSFKGSSAESLKASNASSSSSSNNQSNSAVSAKNISSEEHDNVYYKKLIKYQPQNSSPEKTSQTYNALMGQLQDYDLRVIDNDMFRSKYFKAKPITIERMQNSEDLSKYIAFAKKEANADFFMVGTSIIIDQGMNANTGDSECTGVATVKTYSTVDGESIASETISEAAAGKNINDCAGNLAKKLALVGGPIIGAKVQDYWKRRSTYGREFVLTLTGQALSLMVKSSFTKSLKNVPGIESNVQRSASDTEMQIVVTYKGTDPLDQAVFEALSSNPTFASLDSKTDGNQILLCMGPCKKPESTKTKKK